MINKQSWEIKFDKKFPRPYQGDYRGLHTATKNFIRQLLTSKSEQMSSMKRCSYPFNEENKQKDKEDEFNIAVDICLEILKK